MNLVSARTRVRPPYIELGVLDLIDSDDFDIQLQSGA
jgi:hypothetical protein